jgi:hypothetical protein
VGVTKFYPPTFYAPFRHLVEFNGSQEARVGRFGGWLFFFQGTFASIRSILRAIILIGKAYQGSTLAHGNDRIGARASLVICAITPIQCHSYICSTDKSAFGPRTNPIIPMSQSTCFLMTVPMK